MREKRFFVSKEDIKGNSALLSSDESHHARNVLRLKKGDSVIVFNGEGQEYEGKVSTLSGRVNIELEKKRRTRVREIVSVCLAQALPKKKKMDFIIAKACELGVVEIYPLETDRGSFKLTGPGAERVQARWQKIAVQTCKQSRLDWVPLLHKPIKFKDLLQKTKDYEAVLIPHPDQDLPKFADVVAEIKGRILASRTHSSNEQPPLRKLLLVIGPEGGFSDKEVDTAKQRGAHLVQLGDLVLKTETAAVVGVALVKYSFNL